MDASIFNCNYEGDYIDYNGQELQDTEVSIRNIMSYTGSCRQEFTDGQFERMAYYHSTVRSQQYDASYLVNLVDKVAYEGSDLGMSNVLIMFEHEGTYRHCNTISNAEGQFQGILYSPQTQAYIIKPGSNPDPRFDNNPNDYLVPTTKVILENSYTIEDWQLGVSIKDALLLHQHLMGTSTLDGYKQIAADLDGDGTISLQDSWLMLSLLAGDIQQFPGQKSPWRFLPEYIPQLHAGAFHDSPFDMTIDGITYSQSAPYLNEDWELQIPDGQSGMNGFDGIKLGDLDGSSIPGYDLLVDWRECPEGQAEILYPPEAVAKGQSIRLAIIPKAADKISAFQMGLRLNSELISLKAVVPGELPEFSKERNVRISSKEATELKVIWANPDPTSAYQKDTPLFYLDLQANSALPNLQTALQLDNSLLEAEFLNAEGCSLPVKLLVTSSSRLGEKTPIHEGEVRLSCFPNPARERLSLSFLAGTPGPAIIRIFDTLGKEVSYQASSLENGWNDSSIDINELKSGLYWLMLESPEGSFTQKFMKH